MNRHKPFIVEFTNTDTSELQKLCFERDKKLQRLLKFGERSFDSLIDLHKYYITLDEYHELAKDFENFLFWTPGEYSIEIEITHDVRKKKCFEYTISITDDDYNLLCKNTESIIFGQLYKQSGQPLLCFNSVVKELHNVDERGR